MTPAHRAPRLTIQVNNNVCMSECFAAIPSAYGVHNSDSYSIDQSGMSLMPMSFTARRIKNEIFPSTIFPQNVITATLSESDTNSHFHAIQSPFCHRAHTAWKSECHKSSTGRKYLENSKTAENDWTAMSVRMGSQQCVVCAAAKKNFKHFLLSASNSDVSNFEFHEFRFFDFCCHHKMPNHHEQTESQTAPWINGENKFVELAIAS